MSSLKGWLFPSPRFADEQESKRGTGVPARVSGGFLFFFDLLRGLLLLREVGEIRGEGRKMWGR